MTYDTFHKDADRICEIGIKLENSTFHPDGIIRATPYLLAAHLKKTFPEITDVCNIKAQKREVTIDKVKYSVSMFGVDSSFLRMFDVKIIEGSLDFTMPESKKVAITKEKSKELFQSESPLGKTISVTKGDERTICAVVTGWSEHSNYSFDILSSPEPSDDWGSWYVKTFIKLAPGINIPLFGDKLSKIQSESEFGHKQIITPITSIRYKDPVIDREVTFHHIVLFAVSGILVILCSLFNYLTLFVNRFRIRQKELALRTVFGASGRSLLLLLSIEFIVSMLSAFLLGMILMKICFLPFQKLTNIQMNLTSIYLETILYVGAVMVVSLFIFVILLWILKKRSLNVSIRGKNKHLAQNISIVFQLIISIGFIFCTTVMVKQMYFLRHVDLGFTYQNAASISFEGDAGIELDALDNQLKQIPEITETLKGLNPILPFFESSGTTVHNNEIPDSKEIYIDGVDISKQYAELYGFQLIEGEMLDESDVKTSQLVPMDDGNFLSESNLNVLINESAVKALELEHAVGKKLSHWFTVKGVIRNIYRTLPTTPVGPVMYHLCSKDNYKHSVIFKYEEGKWEACKSKMEQLMRKEYPDASFTIYNTEKEYNKYLKSENALIKLLTAVSLVCIIISIFGFFSQISLSCEERRKEIAIRKINGATADNILSLFFKEYFLLLLIGAIIALPIGYYIMKQWIEKYIKQTDISAWIYVSILFAMASVIVLCVGWRVYRASVENPAEVIKTE
jgi:hypothetical protein